MWFSYIFSLIFRSFFVRVKKWKKIFNQGATRVRTWTSCSAVETSLIKESNFYLLIKNVNKSLPVFLSHVGFSLVYRLKWAMSGLVAIRSVGLFQITDTRMVCQCDKPWCWIQKLWINNNFDRILFPNSIAWFESILSCGFIYQYGTTAEQLLAQLNYIHGTALQVWEFSPWRWTKNPVTQLWALLEP